MRRTPRSSTDTRRVASRGSSRRPPTRACRSPTTSRAYPHSIAEATRLLRLAGVDGPYAIALGPRYYAGLTQAVGGGGYPVLNVVRKLVDGPLVWAPAVNGAVVLSLRGGDFELDHRHRRFDRLPEPYRHVGAALLVETMAFRVAHARRQRWRSSTRTTSPRRRAEQHPRGPHGRRPLEPASSGGGRFVQAQ